MNAICLLVDRLHAGYLGAYGNAWIQTPAIDRLAAGAFAFDQMLIDTPRLENLYRSYWQGWHAMCPEKPPPQRPSLAAMLREAGIYTALLTDERAVARHPLAVDFDQLLEIDPPWQPEGAKVVVETHLAKCCVEVIDWLQSAREPFLLWCHLGGLGTAWDAPLKFRRDYWEQGDPQLPDSAEVPDAMLPEDHDPDVLLGISHSYAGQVSLLDECLGALIELIDDSPVGKETLLTLTSPRGFPLGEHRRVGPCDEALYGELVQVPLLIRFPEALGASGRSQALVGPADLWATLLDSWAIPPEPSPTAGSLMPIVRQHLVTLRDRLCLTENGTQRAIRTPAWYLRTAAESELFAKPDDRWEANNLAGRCHDVVESLQEALAQYEQTLLSGDVADLPPLGEILASGLG